MNDAGRPKTEILLGVTGSIAAYKAVELLRLLVRRNFEVQVVMTQAATRFVGELTFRTLSRNPVCLDSLAEPAAWRPGHVAMAERANAMVIAPCTANVMAKIAHGLADDALSAAALATRAPILIAPAMNDGMWDNPATRDNLETLRRRGIRVLDVGTGDLACGYAAHGRMADPPVILEALLALLADQE